MQAPMPHPELHGWQRLIGTWATQATHPLLPGTVVRGHATFEWLDGRQFLILRWHYDHPEIPDAIAVIGVGVFPLFWTPDLGCQLTELPIS